MQIEPTKQEKKFLLTGEQKLLVRRLAQAIEDCRKANIQLFTTDGENAILCYNATDFDNAIDNDEDLDCSEEWLPIPIPLCDRILGQPTKTDFISWGCSSTLYAHLKQHQCDGKN